MSGWDQMGPGGLKGRRVQQKRTIAWFMFADAESRKWFPDIQVFLAFGEDNETVCYQGDPVKGLPVADAAVFDY